MESEAHVSPRFQTRFRHVRLTFLEHSGDVFRRRRRRRLEAFADLFLKIEDHVAQKRSLVVERFRRKFRLFGRLRHKFGDLIDEIPFEDPQRDCGSV